MPICDRTVLADKKYYLGAVKSSVGHTDLTSGLIGLIKVALSIYHNEIPATLNFNKPNKTLSEMEQFSIVTQNKVWEKDQRIAAVSSFGIGGTNAHILLSKYRCYENNNTKYKSEKYFIPISAKTINSLNQYCNKLLEYLKKHENSLSIINIAKTIQNRRSFEYKKIFAVKSIIDLISRLESPKFQGENIENNVFDIIPINVGKLIWLPGYCFEEIEYDSDLKNSTNNKDENMNTPSILELFQKHLEIDNISKDDNFFELGGDSISAVSLVVDIRDIYRKDLHLTDFMENPNIKDITILINNLKNIE